MGVFDIHHILPQQMMNDDDTRRGIQSIFVPAPRNPIRFVRKF